jgi:PRTRC genetic system protein C
MTRIFKYQDETYEDPGEEFSNEDVKRHLTTYFPELAQATIEEKKLDDGTVEVTFVKRAGTKGAPDLGEIRICSICGELGFANRHRCPPAWYVNIDDPVLAYDEAQQFYARDAQQAAEKFVKWHDRDEMWHPSTLNVTVAKASDPERILHFRVYGEMVSQYHATAQCPETAKA